jgi:hypothetical protein
MFGDVENQKTQQSLHCIHRFFDMTMFFTNDSPYQTKSYPQALAISMVPVLHLDEDASGRQRTRSQRIKEGFIALDFATLNEETSDR